MPRSTQDPLKGSGPDEAGCLRLIELLADGDPLPDTSAICPERQRLITLLVEISKGERSALLPHIAQVAKRRGLSVHEIASRAAFLLACLDTPGHDDAYTILEVSPAATSEEIREAWLSRLSLYHPDRHPENTDWFTRQSARLNDAYQTLKDPARRKTYDERRRREMLARQRGSDTMQSIPSTGLSIGLGNRLMRYRLPALITGGSVAAAGVMAISLFVGRPTHYSFDRAPGASEATPVSLTAVANNHRVVQSMTPRLPASNLRSPTSNLPASQLPRLPARQPVAVAQALPPIVAEPKSLDRQEIDALLDEYIDAYEKADAERLMATLSPRVRERGTLDYQAIRNLYTKGFAGREQIIYRLKNIQVEIKGEQALVTAQYLISARNATQSSKGTNVSGRIEWKIQREGDKSKIVTINY